MTDRLRLAAQAVVESWSDPTGNRTPLGDTLDALRRALAEPAPCPDGVENCPGDCAGERPATVAHYDTLEIAPADHTAVVSNAPCPRCGGSGVLAGEIVRDVTGREGLLKCPGCAK
jgi:hypothetical protein